MSATVRPIGVTKSIVWSMCVTPNEGTRPCVGFIATKAAIETYSLTVAQDCEVRWQQDPYGNFLTHGYESASGRDWARIANLYLADGVWNGERLLPEGYAKFVGSLAPLPRLYV